MTSLGEVTAATSQPERIVAILATLALLGYAAWRTLHWLVQGRSTPDPWDETVASEIAKDDATPLCPRCLNPHTNGTDFGPGCGTPVGQYTNWLPFPYLFSIGHTLRIGTSGEFKRTKLTVLGFFLFSLVEYAVFAPVYWALFLVKLLQPRAPQSPSDQPPVSKPG